MNKQKTHGGARPGAGRPPLPPEQVKSVTLGIRIPAKTHAQLNAAAGRQGLTASEVIRQLIEKLLKKRD